MGGNERKEEVIPCKRKPTEGHWHASTPFNAEESLSLVRVL